MSSFDTRLYLQHSFIVLIFNFRGATENDNNKAVYLRTKKNNLTLCW